MSNEDIIKSAAEAGTVGNWGLGNEYEIQALLTKYGEPTDYLSQDFTMDGFDDDSIKLASAMTFNELGLVKNDYDILTVSELAKRKGAVMHNGKAYGGFTGN